MVTIKQKSGGDPQKTKKGEKEHTTMENNQYTNAGRKRKIMEIQNQNAINKVALIRPHILIIALNVNGLNSPIKRHVSGWMDEKQDPTVWCQQENFKDAHKLKVKGRKDIPCERKPKGSWDSYTYNNQNSWKIYKYMETKQQTRDQPMGERRNQNGNQRLS